MFCAAPPPTSTTLASCLVYQNSPNSHFYLSNSNLYSEHLELYMIVVNDFIQSPPLKASNAEQEQGKVHPTPELLETTLGYKDL